MMILFAFLLVFNFYLDYHFFLKLVGSIVLGVEIETFFHF